MMLYNNVNCITHNVSRGHGSHVTPTGGYYGKIVFRTKKIKNNTVIYSIFELSNDEKLGEISVSTESKKASVNYLFSEQAHKKGLDLCALKLICEHLKNNDIETIVTNVHKENIESNNLIANFGAKKELTSITPYNEYVLKLK